MGRSVSRRVCTATLAAGGLCCLPGLRHAARALEAAPLALVEIAPGLLVSHGAQAEATPANLGAIANTSVIIGTAGVAVIDTGGCLLWGRRLREAVRQRTTLPIVAVVLTHMHPDHIFGAAAFADIPRILGHRNLPAALAARGLFYEAGLRTALGALADGSRVVMPTELVTQTASIDLGDRVLHVAAQARAHTDNDVIVSDPVSGTLWMGDLLFVDRIPALDGSLPGWIAVLDMLRGERAARAVPGHGPVQVGWPDASAPILRYLTTIRDGTQAAIRDGATIDQAVASVGQSERGRWLLFDDYNPRNVTTAYAELEWQ
jgi:quinoprotein relay system zinc metallohydrolase 2